MADGRRSTWVSGIVRAFTENVGLKITSLLIALALFGMVRGAGNVQRSLEVILEARLPPPTARRVLLTDLPDKVRVTVRGAPSLVASLRPDELGPVQIDLSDGHRASVILDPSMFTLPGGVQIEQIQPATLQLSWDAYVERAVPVRAVLSGSPAQGYRLTAEPEVTPATIMVSGASLYVDSLSELHTDVIDITHLGPGHYEPRVALEPPRHHVRFELGDGVRVSFTIEREIVSQTFDHIPVTMVGAPRVELRPPFVNVTVRGVPAAVHAMQPSDVVVTVELTDPTVLTRTGTRLPVQVGHLPSDVTLVSVEPSEVIVLPQR